MFLAFFNKNVLFRGYIDLLSHTFFFGYSIPASHILGQHFRTEAKIKIQKEPSTMQRTTTDHYKKLSLEGIPRVHYNNKRLSFTKASKATVYSVFPTCIRICLQWCALFKSHPSVSSLISPATGNAGTPDLDDGWVIVEDYTHVKPVRLNGHLCTRVTESSSS